MKIGFALITDDPFFDSIIRIENTIHEESGFFDLLGRTQNLPHTTVFQGNMKTDADYHAIADDLAAKYSELIPDHHIRFGDVVYVPDGWYFLEAEKDNRLLQVHKYLLEKLSPYIILDPTREKRDMSFMSAEEISGVRKYGYRYADEAFYPHITLGRTDGFNGELISKLNTMINEIPKDTNIARVTIYKMGNNGTHEKILYEKKL